MKERLTVLLLGKGGKESAMAAKILESPRIERLYMAPVASVDGAETISVDPLDFSGVSAAVESLGIDLVVVGSEDAIVAGIGDALAGCGAKVISPSKECAQLEGSKEFAKEFMSRHAIPTARFMTVTTDTLDEGLGFLDSLKPPYVLKADGLAQGRGVLILDSLADAKDTLTDMLDGMFGDSSATVVIEEYLHGNECSVFLALDGEESLTLPVAKDYKRMLAGDEGPNTQGMGAVSPIGFADETFMEKVMKRIVEPTLRGLKEENLDYRGFLYLGLIELDGEPMLLEYNVRLGDPEAEAVLPRIESDFVDILEGIADQTIALKRIRTTELSCAAVAVCRDVTASSEPSEISGIERCRAAGCMVFPAKMNVDSQGRATTAGFRVAIVSAMGSDPAEAARKAMQGASMIEFEGAFFRNDIGQTC